MIIRKRKVMRNNIIANASYNCFLFFVYIVNLKLERIIVLRRIIILLLLLLIPFNYVDALTIDDKKNVHLECGVTLTYDEYLLFKTVIGFPDELIDDACENDSEPLEYLLTKAKEHVYSGNYLVQVNINGGRTTVTKEEGYKLIENKEDEYIICTSNILLEAEYIGKNQKFPKDLEFIVTNKEPDYEKYCNEEKILAEKLKEENKETDEEKEMGILPITFNNKILTGSIIGVVLITLIALFIHSKYKKVKITKQVTV